MEKGKKRFPDPPPNSNAVNVGAKGKSNNCEKEEARQFCHFSPVLLVQDRTNVLCNISFLRTNIVEFLRTQESSESKHTYAWEVHICAAAVTHKGEEGGGSALVRFQARTHALPYACEKKVFEKKSVVARPRR